MFGSVGMCMSVRDLKMSVLYLTSVFCTSVPVFGSVGMCMSVCDLKMSVLYLTIVSKPVCCLISKFMLW